MRRRRESRERGAVAVEFALMAGLLVVLFFGALEFGLMLRSRSNMSSASREAARSAAALPRQDGFQNAALAVVNGATRNTGDGSIRYVTVYRADPNNGGRPVFSQDFETCTADCYRFEWQDGTGFVQKLGASWDAMDQRACGDVANHDWVGVYLRGEHDWVTGFFADVTTISEFTVMRLEPLPQGEKCR